MPLLDHFHRPLSLRQPWQSMHSAWANAIVQQLNQSVLPAQYYALPNVQFGGRFEIDVAAMADPAGQREAEGGGAAVWAPSRAALVTPIDLTEVDVVEVQVLDESEGRLIAAIELVSPANKDRPASRNAFAVKAASLLVSGVSLTIVDVVTDRAANLTEAIFELLGRRTAAPAVGDLYAITLRTINQSETSVIEAWPEQIRVGCDLPTLPLWLRPDLALPLELEPSYLAACRSLRLQV